MAPGPEGTPGNSVRKIRNNNWCSTAVKKTHTDKNLILANAQPKPVLYLSCTAPGKTHDKKLADHEQIAYPSVATLGKDTGLNFRGIG